MPSPHQCYALMKGGRIYTAQPLFSQYARDKKDSPLYRLGFRFKGFCDGAPCGFFKRKKDFEAFVEREPDCVPLGPHADATFRAELWSTWEGKRLLQKLDEQQQKARGV